MKQYIKLSLLSIVIFIVFLSTDAKAAGITGSTATGFRNIDYDSVVTLNVLDYGADSTGKNDSRYAIQMALYEAKYYASESVQYKIVIPNGEYLITDSLFIYSNTYLCMDSDTVIIKGYDGPNMLRGGNLDETPGYSGIHNVIIEGGEFNANIEQFYMISFSGVRFGHSSNLLFKNVRFVGNVGAHHLEVAGSKNVTITGCYFTGYKGAEMKEAIQLDVINSEDNCPAFSPYDDTSCLDVVINNCTIENVPRGIGSHGAALGSYFSNITIKNCKLKNLTEHGIIAFNYKNCTISGNTMENVGYGISLMYMTEDPANNLFKPADKSGEFTYLPSANYVIENNTMTGSSNASSGISMFGYIYNGSYIAPDSYYMSDIKVNKNTVKDFIIGVQFNDVYNSYIDNNSISNSKDNSQGISGILIIYGNNVSLNSNKLTNCNVNGICVGKNSTKIAINSCIISGSKNNGISINNNSSVSVSKCSITSSKSNGIAINSSKANISGCTVSSNNNNGISYYSKSSGSVKSTKISSNKAAGISIAVSSDALVSSCTISSNKTNGVGVSASKASISSSTINGNTKHGISVSSKASATISSNNIYSNKSHGISVYEASASISKNTIKSNTNHGVCVCKGSKCSITSNKAISSNGGCGVVITEKSSTSISITSNTINSNKKHGVAISNKSKASIGKNTINSNYVHGISISDYANGQNIYSNTIKSNKSYGIALSSKSTGIKIKGNTLSNSGKKNISIASGCKADVGYLNKITASTVKSSSKTITGYATPKKTITAYIGTKKIGSAKASSNGKYTVKIAKQKKGKKITIKQTDSNGNNVYQYIVVK